MKENTEIPFDVDRVAELIEKYRAAETQSERRGIENQVLDATVWQEDDRRGTDTDTYELDHIEMRAVYDVLRKTDASEEVKAMVRGKLVKDV